MWMRAEITLYLLKDIERPQKYNEGRVSRLLVGCLTQEY